MQTLDEVIDQLIDCHTNWARWSQTSDIVDRSAVEDAIEYLKEYQSVKAVLEFKKRQYEEMTEAVMKQGQEGEARCQAEIARYQEAVKNCEAAENKYRQLSEDLGKTSAELSNEPLTWDELRKMEGCPVWIEYGCDFNQKRWVIIHSFHNTRSFCYMNVSGNYPNTFWQKDMGEDEFWQAYRKERR